MSADRYWRYSKRIW